LELLLASPLKNKKAIGDLADEKKYQKGILWEKEKNFHLFFFSSQVHHFSSSPSNSFPAENTGPFWLPDFSYW
jgi:hypothetical protein